MYWPSRSNPMATKVTQLHFVWTFSLWVSVKDPVSPVPNNISAPKFRITRAIQQVDEGILNRIGIKLG